MTGSDSRTDRSARARRGGARLEHRLAALVLALATGLPLRSIPTLLPDPDDQTLPDLGL